MVETATTNIYESTFAKSDKTDAILVVDGHKLHVNKAILSFHSEYFNTLFNGDFKEKSMPEIEIKGVNFEVFAGVLSLILPNPIYPTEDNAEYLLELADRFFLPAAKRHLELFFASTNLSRTEKIKLADKYNLEYLMKLGLKQFTKADEVARMGKYSEFTSDTKAKLFERQFELLQRDEEYLSDEYDGYETW